MPTDLVSYDPKNLWNEKEISRLDWEELCEMAEIFNGWKNISQWAIGKIALTIAKKHGEDSLGKLAHRLRINRKTLYGYRITAKAYSDKSYDEILDTPLSYSHFKYAASLPKKPREKLLKQAHDDSWTVEKLGIEVKKLKTGEESVKESKPELVKCQACGKWRLQGDPKKICRMKH